MIVYPPDTYQSQSNHNLFISIVLDSVVYLHYWALGGQRRAVPKLHWSSQGFSFLIWKYIHPRKLTWKLKMDPCLLENYLFSDSMLECGGAQHLEVELRWFNTFAYGSILIQYNKRTCGPLKNKATSCHLGNKSCKRYRKQQIKNMNWSDYFFLKRIML